MKKIINKLALCLLALSVATNVWASSGFEFTGSPVIECDRVTFSFRLNDQGGPVTFREVPVTITLPSGFSFISSSGPGTVSSTNNVITWNSADMTDQTGTFIVRAPLPGTFIFEGSATDNQGGFHTDSQTGIVVDIPEALNGAVQTAVDTPVVFNIGDFIGSNGSTATSVVIPVAPTHGTLGSVGGASTFAVTYTPDAGFVGYDKIGYQAIDASGCPGNGSIIIAVGTEDVTASQNYGEYVRRVYAPAPEFACPIAGFFDGGSVEHTDVAMIDAGLNTDESQAIKPVTYSVTSPTSAGGTATIDSETGEITYTAPASGTNDTITYQATGADGCASIGEVDITLTSTLIP